MSVQEPALVLRTWAYVQAPSHFGVAHCRCGLLESVWSEYKGHVWCPACARDFVPEHFGVLDGPVPIRSATLLGFDFSRYELATQCLIEDEISQAQQQTWEWVKSHPEVHDVLAQLAAHSANNETKQSLPTSSADS
jgi:hypothetical protein